MRPPSLVQRPSSNASEHRGQTSTARISISRAITHFWNPLLFAGGGLEPERVRSLAGSFRRGEATGTVPSYPPAVKLATRLPFLRFEPEPGAREGGGCLWGAESRAGG